MSKPTVAVASLGGTITMTGGDSALLNPTLSAAALLDSVPATADVAHVMATTLETTPSASLQFTSISRALNWAHEAVAGGAVGAVLIQGTDTIEETAYLLDLLWTPAEPLIVTGAMRPPQVPGADGPANLLAAVRTAASPQSRDLGALVVLNDAIHAAARVRKSDSAALEAFASPSFGPLGRVHEHRVVYGNRPARWPTITARFTDRPPRVAIVPAYLGDDGGQLELVTDAGYDGVVLDAFGAGHVSQQAVHAVDRATARCPVVVATRTGRGATYVNSYGFPGSESDLIARGAIPAGWLDARKARILLCALLAAGTPPDALRAEIIRRGQQPAGPHPD